MSLFRVCASARAVFSGAPSVIAAREPNEVFLGSRITGTRAPRPICVRLRRRVAVARAAAGGRDELADGPFGAADPEGAPRRKMDGRAAHRQLQGSPR